MISLRLVAVVVVHTLKFRVTLVPTRHIVSQFQGLTDDIMATIASLATIGGGST